MLPIYETHANRVRRILKRLDIYGKGDPIRVPTLTNPVFILYLRATRTLY
jgi:hypothetical protein